MTENKKIILENYWADVRAPEGARVMTRAVHKGAELVRLRPRLAVATLTLVLVAVWYVVSSAQTPEAKAAKELAAAVSGVSDLMILPEGDQPVLATITDAKALIAQQTFFAGSVNGDKLLLFPKNMKAVIWSPSRNKIVNAGPIEQTTNSKQLTTDNVQQATVAAPSVLSVEIRNGTSKSGLATKTAEKIGSQAGYSVVKVASASKKDYAKTVVFSSAKDDSKKQMASALAGELGGDIIQTIPNSEKGTDADILVILGGN